MAKMATQPVFACRVCGKPVVVAHLSTTVNDPSGELLKSLMQKLAEIALCPWHQNVRNYYARQGRENEFIREQLNPRLVLLSVIDNSGLNYYNDKPAEKGKS